MKVTLFSNFLNHHQLPFCLEMKRLLGDGFKFVACSPISKECRGIGYQDMNSSYDFVIREYESTQSKKAAEQLAIDSDAIIIGSAPVKYAKMRAENSKLTFIYSERLFKKGIHRRFVPTTRYKVHKRLMQFNNTNTHILCASAYTAYDLSLCGWKGNMYRWGYFPEVRKYDIDMLFSLKADDTVRILWCGRFIPLKHPEKAIKLANYLKKNHLSFKLNMIGNGKLVSRIQNLINRNNLGSVVTLLGAMPPDEVRNQMEASHIFLFTSDFNEGWGAVLNEAMNSGCAVVASHAIGAVPFLIEHRRNGLIYENSKIKDFYNCVKKLVIDRKTSQKLGEEAYKTMINKWNIVCGAKRLMTLINELQKNENSDIFKEGPCSSAKLIKNNWFKGE